MQQWGGVERELGEADLGLLVHERELALCARLAAYPEVVQTAAADYAPHQVAFYLKDLAGDFHSWYNAERMLVDDVALRDARVALAAAVRTVLASGLAMLGVSAPASM
jgi:arginyl-tRNA synthetase